MHGLLFWFASFTPALPMTPRPRIDVRLEAPEVVSAERLATVVEPEPSARPSRPTNTMPSHSSKQLRAKAQAALTKHLFYPEEAIRQGWQGDVILLLTIDDAGRVTAVEVSRGSGHAILDQAAHKAAQQLGRLGSRSTHILLPVEFRLD